VILCSAICSSETSVDFQRDTRRYNPDCSILNEMLFSPHFGRVGPFSKEQPVTLLSDKVSWVVAVTITECLGVTFRRFAPVSILGSESGKAPIQLA
jgi:hypothetical protein